ncbi:MAG: beta-propeller fold lactonase family protein, partial [Legionellaceae bacterium]
CTLTFTPGTDFVRETFFEIKADSNNTTTLVEASIAVNEASQINLTVAGSPMTLYANGGYAPDGVKDMTITNTSTTEIAYNVTALLGDLGAAVEVSTCTSIAPGASCSLTFESNTSTEPATDVVIQGTNTNATEANITVERAPYAYIANDSTNNLSRCPMSTRDGTLSDCAVVASENGLNRPIGIAINSSKTYLYVLNHAATIQVCQIAAGTGALTCVNSGSIGTANVQGIAIDPSDAYLYVARHDGSVIYKCSITGSGATVGGCGDSGATGGNSPEQIAMNADGSKLYVAAMATTYVCPVDMNTGNLGQCVDTTAGSSGQYPSNARGVAITADGFYAYISGTDSISGCSVAGDGTFSNCARINVANSIIGIGADIDVNREGTLAYVATAKTGTSGSYIALCNLLNGLVTGCSSTGTGTGNSSAGESHGIGLLQ